MNTLLDAFTRPICLEKPLRLSGVPSWVEHIPFAMNLVAVIQPRVLVELGTHAGDSYLAFCQAVQHEGLSTRCFAVDTWKGDSQAGFYGPEILEQLAAHHGPRYGGFSRLVQSTFDEALEHFSDGSIDLLHIDGFHTYEAIRGDYEAWLPKLSPRGVVIFHDVNVRERDFGAWKFWEEIRACHPHFEFVHGHGLGVLAPGPEVPPPLRPLFESSEEQAALVRRFYFELGQRVASGGECTRLVRELTAHDEELGRIREELAHKVASHDEELARERAQAREVDAELGRVRSEMAQLQERLVRAGAARADLERSSAELKQQVEALGRGKAVLQSMAEQRQSTIDGMTGTAAWRVAARYWAARDRVLGAGGVKRRVFDTAAGTFKKALKLASRTEARGTSAAIEQAAGGDPYESFAERHDRSPAQLRKLREVCRGLPHRPLISILTPVYNVDEPWLRKCLDSVLAQVYEEWELCLVDDASPSPHIVKVLEEYVARDPRIRFERSEKNGGIVAASTRALAMCKGEFVALLDHDDELTPDALYEVVLKLEADPEIDLVYSDEDKLDPEGRRTSPFFKPDWSPNLLMAMNYICHLGVYRRTLLEEVGGFRAGFDGSQDFDLVLRFTERARRVAHVPRVLYHWRMIPQSAAASTGAKPYAYVAAQKALESALERRRVKGAIRMTVPGLFRTSYRIEGEPLISIVIPTRDRADILRTCIESIESKSTWRNYEIVVVDNGSTDPATLAYLDELRQRHRILDYSKPFNWSALNNFAAGQAKGDYLLFMNNDMEVIEPGWMEALLEHAQRKEVGAVGGLLLYPDGRIQHAGVVMGIGGVAGHAFKHRVPEYSYYFGLQLAVRDCSAVTGACLMVRRAVFEEVGGFDQQLRVAFNDVDFCLKLRSSGYANIYTPHARLYHFESATRGALHPPEDESLMRSRWQASLSQDAFYNPNLSMTHEDFRLAE